MHLTNVVGQHKHCVPVSLQMEIDYKAECHSGDAIESLGSSIKEDTNGTGIRR